MSSSLIGVRKAIWCFALLLASALASGSPGVPDCLRGYGTKLRKILGREDAEVLFSTINGFSPKAQNGTRALLDASQDGEGLYDTIFETLERRFQPGSPGNPFPSEEALFEAIGDLNDASPGSLDAVLRALNKQVDDGGILRSQGAIFDIFVARNTTSGRALGFQYRVNVGSGTRYRVSDMVEIDPTCAAGCGVLSGRIHENKNWTVLNPEEVVDDPLPNPNGGFIYGNPEGKISGLADEFARDIVLVGGGQRGFGDMYRLNLNSAVGAPGQRAAIRKLLLKQFDSPYVVSQFAADPGRLAALRADFEDVFPSIVRFIP